MKRLTFFILALLPCIQVSAGNPYRFSAHRGLQPFGPENSIASFEAAAEHGLWAIETDFRQTGDGRVVCMHDADIFRTTGVNGKVSEFRLSDLRRIPVLKVNSPAAELEYDYDALRPRQKRIPTMEEYFRICRKGGCLAFIELKEDGGVIRKMMKAIRRFGMTGRCIVSSSKLSLLKSYRAQGGKEMIHLIFGRLEDIGDLLALGNAAIAFNYPDLSVAPDLNYNGIGITSLGQLVELCHSLGLKVCFRAVDTPGNFYKSQELGIDYYPTNNLWKGKLTR